MAEDKNTFEEDVESAEFITLEYEDGTFSLADIEDDEEFAAVSEMYESLMDEGDVDDEDEDSEEE